MVKRLAFKLTNQPPAPETGLRSNMKTSKLFHGESEAVKRDIHTAQHAPELLEMVKRFVMYYEGNETKPEGVYKIKCAKDIIERATTA